MLQSVHHPFSECKEALQKSESGVAFRRRCHRAVPYVTMVPCSPPYPLPGDLEESYACMSDVEHRHFHLKSTHPAPNLILMHTTFCVPLSRPLPSSAHPPP